MQLYCLPVDVNVTVYLLIMKVDKSATNFSGTLEDNLSGEIAINLE